jgi:hypothetical protein
MAIDTTDVRTHGKEQIDRAIEVLGDSEDRRKVFEEVYRGKRTAKTTDEIARKSGLDIKRVLEVGLYLYNHKMIDRNKVNGRFVFIKIAYYSLYKEKIIQGALKEDVVYRVKRVDQKTEVQSVTIKLPKHQKPFDIKLITIDDINSFDKVAAVKLAPDIKYQPILEEDFQQGLQKILQEYNVFKDWGGEGDDLYTSRLIIGAKRVAVAFALKGRGTKGKLTPGKLGSQGDQIQRLFEAPAEVFLIQYWGQIDETVLKQMKLIATAKSASERKRIYYGVIDGQDTLRIIQAYPEFFEKFN